MINVLRDTLRVTEIQQPQVEIIELLHKMMQPAPRRFIEFAKERNSDNERNPLPK